MKVFIISLLFILLFIEGYSSNSNDSLRDTIYFNLTDTILKAGKKYILHVDYSHSDDKWLKYYNNDHVDSLLIFLKRNPGVIIEIGAHTDCRAPIEHNDSLSYHRARELAEYLVYKRISYHRLIPRGYGEREHLINCPCYKCTEEEHSINRRIEVKLLDIKKL